MRSRHSSDVVAPVFHGFPLQWLAFLKQVQEIAY